MAHNVFLELFDPVEVVEADMTTVAKSLTPMKGPGNRAYFALKHDVILTFGASGISARTEVGAQIGWSMTVSSPRYHPIRLRLTSTNTETLQVCIQLNAMFV